jgi:hypothetical protein
VDLGAGERHRAFARPEIHLFEPSGTGPLGWFGRVRGTCK